MAHEYAYLHTAERVARVAHAGQVEASTGDPYIWHVERVVGLVDTPEAKAVAWLHDVLEDSPITVVQLLHQDIPQAVVDAVLLLTRPPHASPAPDATYHEYIDKIRQSGNPLAIQVKQADLQDHLRPNCPARLRPRYERAAIALTQTDDIDWN